MRSAIFALLLAAISAGRCSADPKLDALAGCENNIVNRIAAPDEKHWAIIYKRDCGATTGWELDVAIVDKSNPDPTSLKPNAFSCETGDANAIKVSWQDESLLVIQADWRTRINSKERFVDLVRIRLEIENNSP